MSTRRAAPAARPASGRGERWLAVLAVVAGLVAASAGGLIARDYLTAPEPVLVVESVTGIPTHRVLDAAGVARQSPRSIVIDDIELWSAVSSVGLTEGGELEVPDTAVVGWYEHGSAPGLPGATVLAAHVSWNGEIGPFFKLGSLEPGALVTVRLQDGTPRTYEVIERTMYAKDALPEERIWRTTGEESLVLITCGGSFNESIGRYRDNIVVYAVPVDVPVDAAASTGP